MSSDMEMILTTLTSLADTFCNAYNQSKEIDCERARIRAQYNVACRALALKEKQLDKMAQLYSQEMDHALTIYLDTLEANLCQIRSAEKNMERIMENASAILKILCEQNTSLSEKDKERFFNAYDSLIEHIKMNSSIKDTINLIRENNEQANKAMQRINSIGSKSSRLLLDNMED